MSSTKPHRAGIALSRVLTQAQLLRGDVVATSCTSDSRHVRPGDAFFAIEGAEHDGHQFAHQAEAQGAVAIVAERVLPNVSVPLVVVPDTRIAYGECCQALVGQPSTEMNVVGIAGTQGKSSTIALLAAILEESGARTGTMSTLGFSDSLVAQAATPCPPSPPVWANWLANMSAAGCTHALLEVSSAALSQHQIAGIQLDMACITNVTRNHLDLHNSMANYRAAQRRVFDHLSEDGLAVVNADDPEAAAALSHVDGPALSFGLDRPAEITGKILEQHISEQYFLLTIGNQSAVIHTPIIGEHHVSNCLAAATIASAYGVDLVSIAKGLESVERLDGRMERIECGQPFAAFVDDAHTPDAMAACLTAAKEVTRGRLICVFGADGHKERQQRPSVGAAVARLADVAVITSADAGDEDPARIASDLASTFHDDHRPRIVHDRPQAIGWALEEAEAGDTIVIAGRGATTALSLGSRRFELDDREVVRELLYRKNSSTLPDRAAA